jgi:hypothetical protein
MQTRSSQYYFLRSERSFLFFAGRWAKGGAENPATQAETKLAKQNK